MDHEPGRWSRVARPMDTARPVDAPPGEAVVNSVQQMHLVSQGYPVRIRRALVAGGMALAMVVGGTLAASVTIGGVPTSEQSDAIVTTPVGSGS